MEEEIKITKAELEGLIQKGIAEAMGGIGNSIRKKKVTEHFVRLTKIDDKYVVDIEPGYTTRKTADGVEELVVSVILKDGDKTKKQKATLSEIHSSPKVEVKIIEKKDNVEEVIGKPIPEVVHEDDYRSHATGRYVENIVEIPHPTYKVVTPEGDELTLKDNVINL